MMHGLLLQSALQPLVGFGTDLQTLNLPNNQYHPVALNGYLSALTEQLEYFAVHS
jgi:hypothetical protein